jgi:hypothetical protein
MSARVVWVRAAMASMLAPLNPRAANSAIAALMIRARLAAGSFGLHIAAVRIGDGALSKARSGRTRTRLRAGWGGMAAAFIRHDA